MLWLRGHYVYKTNQTPVLNDQLNYKKENCENALSYNKHSFGVFKKDETLVGHILIELSRLSDYFIKENKENLEKKT